MTSNHPLAAAVRNADRTYSRFDRHRDRNTLRRIITGLGAAGHSTADIANRVNLDTKQVRRIINGQVADQRPNPINPADLTDQHCRQLERTADIAITLACRLRDEDPQIVWDALTHLDRGPLQELAVVLLAALPVNQPKNTIFAWVNQIGDKL